MGAFGGSHPVGINSKSVTRFRTVRDIGRACVYVLEFA